MLILQIMLIDFVELKFGYADLKILSKKFCQKEILSYPLIF
jgi:hypothetical protein